RVVTRRVGGAGGERQPADQVHHLDLGVPNRHVLHLTRVSVLVPYTIFIEESSAHRESTGARWQHAQERGQRECEGPAHQSILRAATSRTRAPSGVSTIRPVSNGPSGRMLKQAPRVSRPLAPSPWTWNCT